MSTGAPSQALGPRRHGCLEPDSPITTQAVVLLWCPVCEVLEIGFFIPRHPKHAVEALIHVSLRCILVIDVALHILLVCAKHVALSKQQEHAHKESNL